MPRHHIITYTFEREPGEFYHVFAACYGGRTYCTACEGPIGWSEIPSDRGQMGYACRGCGFQTHGLCLLASDYGDACPNCLSGEL